MKNLLLLNAHLVIFFLFLLNIGCTTNGEAAENSESAFPVPVYDSEPALQDINSNLGRSPKSQGSMQIQAASLTQRGITVTGSGSVSVEPNLAIMNIGVEVLAKTVNVARSAAADAMDSVTDTLKKESVRDTDIQTRRFNISPRYDYEEVIVDGRHTGKQVLTGYVVNNSAIVKIRDLENVGQIVDKAADAGGDLVRIDGISFTVENDDLYLSTLRKQAVEDAFEKATQYASLTGVELGPILSLSEIGNPSVQSFAEMDYGMRAMAAPASSSISGGELEITLSVNAVFSIQ